MDDINRHTIVRQLVEQLLCTLEALQEDENRRLKKLLAESMLDVSALKDLLGKN